MWRSRKQKTRKTSEDIEIGIEQRARKLAGYVLAMQRRVAEKLNRTCSTASPGKIKCTLLAFVLANGLAGTTIIWSALTTKKKELWMLIQKPAVPKNLNDAGSEHQGRAIGIDDATGLKWTTHKAFLDSMKARDSVRYDSLVKASPGLMDSLLKIETLFSKIK